MFEDFIRTYPPALPAPVDESNTRRLEALLESALAALQDKSEQLARAYRIGQDEHKPAVSAKVLPASGSVMTCEVCGIGQMDATQKGIAGRSKWQNHFNGKYACESCRKASGI